MRKKSMTGYLKGNLKRKATKNRNELAYMLMWGEKPKRRRSKS